MRNLLIYGSLIGLAVLIGYYFYKKRQNGVTAINQDGGKDVGGIDNSKEVPHACYGVGGQIEKDSGLLGKGVVELTAIKSALLPDFCGNYTQDEADQIAKGHAEKYISATGGILIKSYAIKR